MLPKCRVLQSRIAVLAIMVSCLLPITAFSNEITKPIRAFHMVLLGINLNEAKHVVDLLAEQKMNVIVLEILWGASVRLKTCPWEVRSKPWEARELVDMVRYSRAKGIEVVPHIPLLSHQRALLAKHRPDLLYNQATYNPDAKSVYELVLPMLDELTDLIKPKAIHIGHDEVVGWEKSHFGKFLGDNERPLPAELFLKDVLILHDHLKKKGIATWMWGDMLISPDEFPGMKREQLHGQLSGYGKVLRSKLPHDIVICDWHYLDDQPGFPSLATFRNEGFRVIGVTWKKEKTIRNFSRYAAEHSADGMMATTWFHVQRREWDVVDHIIQFSGEAFLKDFPDFK